jgi:hypothetical protein
VLQSHRKPLILVETKVIYSLQVEHLKNVTDTIVESEKFELFATNESRLVD